MLTLLIILLPLGLSVLAFQRGRYWLACAPIVAFPIVMSFLLDHATQPFEIIAQRPSTGLSPWLALLCVPLAFVAVIFVGLLLTGDMSRWGRHDLLLPARLSVSRGVKVLAYGPAIAMAFIAWSEDAFNRTPKNQILELVTHFSLIWFLPVALLRLIECMAGRRWLTAVSCVFAIAFGALATVLWSVDRSMNLFVGLALWVAAIGSITTILYSMAYPVEALAISVGAWLHNQYRPWAAFFDRHRTAAVSKDFDT
jgi:hypothetical protein